MEHVGVGDVDSTVFDDGTLRWRLADPLGTTSLAINRYQIPPGGGLPGGLHAHMDQEEVFVVIEGAATFETMPGEVTVEAGEAIRFAPGEFQSGRNDADVDLVVLAIGAPKETEDIRIPVACHACGFETVRLAAGEHGVTFVCPDCEAKGVPSGCPECGHDDLRVTIDGQAGTVVICEGCAAQFDEPPLRV